MTVSQLRIHTDESSLHRVRAVGSDGPTCFRDRGTTRRAHFSGTHWIFDPANCRPTTSTAAHVNRIAAYTLNPLDPRMIFPGLADELLFGQGLLDSDLDLDLDLESARRRFRVDLRIKKNLEREDLSDWIRHFEE